MKIRDTVLYGVKIIDNFSSQDERGIFVKIYNNEEFQKNGMNTDFKESFYSISKKNVVRGMHFQLPPYDVAKIVHVLSGKITDVVMDLRKSSSTFGKCLSIDLDANIPQAIYIPSGFAHGFISREDNTITMYHVTCGYNRECDAGIKWDSIPFEWGTNDPIISERDLTFGKWKEFVSPF